MISWTPSLFTKVLAPEGVLYKSFYFFFSSIIEHISHTLIGMGYTTEHVSNIANY